MDTVCSQFPQNNNERKKCMKTTPKSIYPAFAALVLTWFTLSPPNAFGVSPAPDGGYPGGNTAEGTNALFSRTTGVWNTASGFEASKAGTTGSANTAVGFEALLKNLGGDGNTAVGAQALLNNNGGDRNIAVGLQAGINITTGSNNIDIGSTGSAGESGVIRIGGASQTAAYVAGISSTHITGSAVYVR